ncbi:MAG TPA: hypothetical protein VFE18_09525 [Phenylobacterium sp.]|jgi:hypothetical protein|uniref:hypothetical protein n=1 Tax=Phenylobacterium sp. TaxID=1871053 RepID=UPI002D63608F|nr:hypothetical protein [Phenylobacterium sp.]HZZ68401.1 hypothetical protein [Phenylobacterium sp.]
MKFEVVESDGDWIVRRDGVELARLGDQEEALNAIAERLRNDDVESELSYSLTMRYQARA